MSHWNRRRIIRVAGRLFVLVGSLFLVWMLAGLNFNFPVQSPLAELQAAQAQWEQQALSDYQMTIYFGSFTSIAALDFTVRENRVMSIEPARDFPFGSMSISTDDVPNWYTGQPWSFDTFLPPTLKDYTIDQLFDFAAQKLASEPTLPLVSWCSAPEKPRYEATFDEARGNLASFSYTSCVRSDWGGGLLCPAIADCAAGFTIRNLQPLE